MNQYKCVKFTCGMNRQCAQRTSNSQTSLQLQTRQIWITSSTSTTATFSGLVAYDYHCSANSSIGPHYCYLAHNILQRETQIEIEIELGVKTISGTNDIAALKSNIG